MPENFARYTRQMRYPPLGEEGQRRLNTSTALVCGCGALGSVVANTLVRAGVGRVRIVDRDFVETDNLHRQMLFDEDDAEGRRPKAVAAAEKLRRFNAQVEIEPIVADVDHTNIEPLCQGVDTVVDGTDNYETRLLLNDAALKFNIPWVYGACLGAEGQTMTILPGETACFRCLVPECPTPGTMPTCDTAGILAPVVGVIASIESAEALKILSGNRQDVSRKLTVVELWENRIVQLDATSMGQQADCPACQQGQFPWLAGTRGAESAVLCGRNAVQLRHLECNLSLDELAVRLGSVGEVTQNEFLLRLAVEGYEITLFADGRAIIGGTDDVSEARTVYAKYVGN